MSQRNPSNHDFRRLRILQVVPRYAPAWAFGGGVRITYELARQWVAMGHEVVVFTSNEGAAGADPLPAKEVLDGIQIERFPVARHALARRFPFLFFRPCGLKRALWMRTHDFDIIHLAESRGPHNRWLLAGARDKRPPVVWSAYGGLAKGMGLRRVYRAGHDLFYRTGKLVRSTDRLIAQTEHEAIIYRSFGATDAQIVQLPLAVSQYDVLKGERHDPGLFRAKHGIDPDAELVLFVGRLHWTKGLQLLIPAFADVLRVRPKARLAIVGWDQGFAAAARTLVRENGVESAVFFVGPVFGDDRFSAYCAADVFALTPGIFEETSLAALEACAVGTPCVITQQCEIPGLMHAGGGLMVKYQKAEIAAALIRILAEGGRALWGERARELIHTQFISEKVAAQHLDLFNSVLRPPRVR